MTQGILAALPVLIISIHTLRMEGDKREFEAAEATAISIHTLRMEGDRGQHHQRLGRRISIHTLRMEGDSSPTSPSITA